MNEVDISIIIATRNRESVLWATIKKATDAIEGTGSEIIVVNDGDKEFDIPPFFSKKILCFNNNKRGVSAARNLGASYSKGTLLFFVDDDMWINREAIDWIYTNLVNKKTQDAVYNINWEYPPELEEKLRKNKIGKYILATGYNTMWNRMHVKGDKPQHGLYLFDVIASCSLLIPKKIFNKVGKYNESIPFQGEDIDLANRINALSIPVYCIFDVTLNHNHEDRLDFNGFFDRVKKGYQSQYIAEKNRLIPLSPNNYTKPKTYFFDIFLFTEELWIKVYKFFPNNKFFEPLSNKLIGLLSGMEKYRQWKNIFSKK